LAAAQVFKIRARHVNSQAVERRHIRPAADANCFTLAFPATGASRVPA
jgi:hypothetical protein